MVMNALYQFLPWQLEQARRWLGRRERFAHAWLVHGLPGIGKRSFARASAASLLCETPVQGIACGTCPACQWVATGNHPDLRLIRPQAMAISEGESQADDELATAAAKKAPSRDIRIEQLRELTHWFNTATHRGGWRVAVIYPAQAMNHITANALLKVLEEPPEHTVFLMVADAPDRLLATLVSRCRRLPVACPDTQTAMQWLEKQGVADADQWLALAGGAPLLAQELAAGGNSPCPNWLQRLMQSLAAGQSGVAPLADELEKEPASYWLDMLARLATDLTLAAAGQPVRYFVALHEPIARVARQAQAMNLAEIAHWLVQQKAVAGHPLNAKLFVHTALQRLSLACQPASSATGMQSR